MGAVPPPADLGGGELLPLHELPLYVVDEPQSTRIHRRSLTPSTQAAPADPRARPPGSWTAPAGTGTAAYFAPARRTDVRFTRLVLLPFDDCTRAIEQWRRQCWVDGEVRVGASRLTNPRELPSKMVGPYRLGVVLRSGFGSFSLPMELEVMPRYSYATMIVLLPRHRVVLLRRYFRAGHRLLDTVIDAIEVRRRPLGRFGPGTGGEA